MLPLEWFRSFVEVYRIGSVSGAAEVLHLPQPVISQHIAALESALGQTLFTPMPGPMLPTNEGKFLYIQAVAAVEKRESISTRMLPVNTLQVVRLGTSPEFFAESLLSLLPQARNLRYRIRIGLKSDLMNALLDGDLDAVITIQKVPHPDLEYQLILVEDFWLVVSPNIVVPIAPDILQADLRPLDQWICTQPLVAYSEELPIIRRFWRAVFGRRIDVVPQLVLPDFLMIRQAIAAGFGFSVLPDYLCESMVASHQLTLVLKANHAVANQLWLTYRRSEKNYYRIALLRELLHSTRYQGLQKR
jgi:DNA-binding transcriptional LysR family regulator